jgi:thioredoxin 1
MKRDQALDETDPVRSIAAGSANEPANVPGDSGEHSRELPKLLDLGADKCIPCKLMAPILENLKEEYAGRMEVEFIDVWKHPEAGKQYGVEMIPTQIFYDSDGKELFRHTGFFGKEDILAKWEELGVEIGETQAAAPIVREAPAAADDRPRDSVCFMCDGDVEPKAKTSGKALADKMKLTPEQIAKACKIGECQ